MLKQCATLLLALALSLCLQCHSAAAARKLHQAVVRLIPTYAKMYGHDVYYQVSGAAGEWPSEPRPTLPLPRRSFGHCPWLPTSASCPGSFGPQVPQSPIGTVFLAHGCVHSGADYWPPSSACPECRGACVPQRWASPRSPAGGRPQLSLATQLRPAACLCCRAAHGAGAYQAGTGPRLRRGGSLLRRPHHWVLLLVSCWVSEYLRVSGLGCPVEGGEAAAWAVLPPHERATYDGSGAKSPRPHPRFLCCDPGLGGLTTPPWHPFLPTSRANG